MNVLTLYDNIMMKSPYECLISLTGCCKFFDLALLGVAVFLCFSEIEGPVELRSEFKCK